MTARKVICHTATGVLVLLGCLTAAAGELDSVPSFTEKASDQPPATLQIPDAASQPTSGVDRAAPAELDGLDQPSVRGETVTERYPDGSVKLEREVIQDASGSYVNHGKYTLYDPNGEVVKTGEFCNGRQQGAWKQTLLRDLDHLFSTVEDKEFVTPFTSEAAFVEGDLQGPWTIKDREGRNLIQWNFERGVREGQSTWWHSNGQKRLEATYHGGVLDGEVQEFDRDGKQVSQESYVAGKRVIKVTEYYAPGQKHFEGFYLRASSVAEPAYDWWTSSVKASPAATAQRDQKHGRWISWYRNGNQMTAGQFSHDLPDGKFTWWYENGQVQAEGEYQAGVKAGTWTTWHPNGLRSSQGEYRSDSLTGKFMRWDADGRLAEIHDLSTMQPEKKPARPMTTPRPATTQRPMPSHAR